MKRLTDKQMSEIGRQIYKEVISISEGLRRATQTQLDQDRVDCKKEKALMFNPDWKPDIAGIIKDYNEVIKNVEVECKQKVKDERQRILSMGWKKFLKELETELDERCFG